MRRVLVVTLMLGLVLALPGIAGAGRPDRFSDDRWSLVCDTLEATDGSAVFVAVEISREFGSFAFLGLWAPGTEPFFDEPAAISVDGTASLAGTELLASFPMFAYDPTTDPPVGASLGTAELIATLTAVGDPEEFEFSFKEGNRVIRGFGVRQVYAVGGQLTLHDGSVVDLDGCHAENVVETFFGTNPARAAASFIFRSQGIQLNCFWEVDGGFLGLFASADQFGTFSDVFIETEGAIASGGSNDVVLTTTAFSATYELLDEGGGPAGSASASATLTPTGERFRLMDRFNGETFKILGEVLSVAGGVSISLNGSTFDLTMNDEACSAIDGRTMSHFVDPRGPKAKPLANDAPEGAAPLRIGRSARVVTGANAPEPEVPCIGEDEFGDPVEYPITYTAWWQFTGTGDEVTVSTAGSNFDTIVGVYQLVGDEIVPLACVDDVFDPEFSFQAVVTVGTEAGATYLIQAGGFAGSTGRLKVSLQ